ncbi:FLYWCH zinc finger domain-containing protein [Phthorimaea operculella]|nr:FLYWCH zinc finger domain-containing protein [Phthorimaea operculella]
MMVNTFPFCEESKLRDKVIWRCTSKKTNCKARIHMLGSSVVAVKGMHNHPPRACGMPQPRRANARKHADSLITPSTLTGHMAASGIDAMALVSSELEGFAPAGIAAAYIPTSRGKKHLVLHGYAFTENVPTFWICSRYKKGCRAQARTNKRGEIVSYSGDHNHDKPSFLETTTKKLLFSAFFLPSRAGKSVLIFQLNKFWVNNQYRGKLNWACRDKDVRSCTCRVQTTLEGRFIRIKGAHNHPPNFTPENFAAPFTDKRDTKDWHRQVKVELRWVKSRWGNPVLEIEGQRFRRVPKKMCKGSRTVGKDTWLCIKSDTGCKCYAVTQFGQIVAMGYHHTHNIKKRKRQIRNRRVVVTKTSPKSVGRAKMAVKKKPRAVVPAEPTPTLGLPFPFPCFPGQFRYCLSKRGKPAIEVGAHRFCFNGRAASGKVWWRCSRNPRCRAAVHTFGLRVVQMNSAHTCGVRATPLRPMF